jgi:NAD(P) transhydrogenase subunit alpha
LTPDSVGKLVADGHDVVVVSGAGDRAGFADHRYVEAGAAIVERDVARARPGVLLTMSAPDPGPTPFGPEQVLIGLLDPRWRSEPIARLAAGGATVVALELMPRITRAQSMDVLSSMATVVGTEAVLLAAIRLPKLFPLMMTAAGTIPPAKVLVLGAGVAGLQAIATARRLGAVVEAYDVRPAAAEQIRSLGAKAIELDVETADSEDEGGYARAQGDEVAARQQAALTAHVAGADVVITTAAIPGAASPRLITTPMVEAMAPGSVIVDLAAERGGNCELTEADRDVTHSGVLILGPTDLVSSSAQSASQMFSTNLLTLIRHLDDEGRLVLDMDDEITSAIVVAKGGALLQADTSS